VVARLWSYLVLFFLRDSTKKLSPLKKPLYPKIKSNYYRWFSLSQYQYNYPSTRTGILLNHHYEVVTSKAVSWNVRYEYCAGFGVANDKWVQQDA
jgi:hypothetical protein